MKVNKKIEAQTNEKGSCVNLASIASVWLIRTLICTASPGKGKKTQQDSPYYLLRTKGYTLRVNQKAAGLPWPDSPRSHH